jgi:uncharacterized membrane protein
MKRLATAAALEGGRELPTRYHRLARAWFVLGWPAFIAMFTILHLMVFKPGS